MEHFQASRARRGDDGHRWFSSLSLTASTFIGPMVAANTWIPARDGVHLGFTMGEHNLLGQLLLRMKRSNFSTAVRHTLFGHLQRYFKKLANAASH